MSLESQYLILALEAARAFEGATQPNPPVGAVVVHSNGLLVGAGSHERAGAAHAEVLALATAKIRCNELNLKLSDCTLYITLEPCNHQGKTPPCTGAILKSGVKRVRYASRDLNGDVKGGGEEFLRSQGIDIQQVSNSLCEDFNAPFFKFCKTRTPWVVHKIALRALPALAGTANFTMIPPDGERTFTGEAGLKVAHDLRKRSDAIITTFETITKDEPLFNVRHVQDHLQKRRYISVISRSGKQAPGEWIGAARSRGFEVLHHASMEDALKDLGAKGCIRAMVEAGPKFSEMLAASQNWDERLWIMHSGGADQIRTERKV